MIQDILFALWFFLPAGVANMTPILAARVPGLGKLDTPMDFGRSYEGVRIFGEHKTWRGLVSGMLAGVLTLWLQQLLAAHTPWAAWLGDGLDYQSLPTIVVGALFGFGALAGDAIESFFKRRRNIRPGHSWFPFDQTDYVIGGALATAPFVRLSLLQYIMLVIIWLAIHVAATYAGYLLKLKERPI